MKRPVAMEKVNKVLDRIEKTELKAFIIDDEGDQASLNTEYKKNRESATYNQIKTMIETLNYPLYLSVTATPQANVLLGEYSELKPQKLFLIEPSNNYVGSEFFHLNDSHIILCNKIFSHCKCFSKKEWNWRNADDYSHWKKKNKTSNYLWNGV